MTEASGLQNQNSIAAANSLSTIFYYYSLNTANGSGRALLLPAAQCNLRRSPSR